LLQLLSVAFWALTTWIASPSKMMWQKPNYLLKIVAWKAASASTSVHRSIPIDLVLAFGRRCPFMAPIMGLQRWTHFFCICFYELLCHLKSHSHNNRRGVKFSMNHNITSKPYLPGDPHKKFKILLIKSLKHLLYYQNKLRIALCAFLNFFPTFPPYIHHWWTAPNDMIGAFIFKSTIGYDASFTIPFFTRLSLIGKRLWHALHKNILVALGIVNYQIIRQMSDPLNWVELSPLTRSCLSFSIW